jgi:hypothetical protein
LKKRGEVMKNEKKFSYARCVSHKSDAVWDPDLDLVRHSKTPWGASVIMPTGRVKKTLTLSCEDGWFYDDIVKDLRDEGMRQSTFAGVARDILMLHATTDMKQMCQAEVFYNKLGPCRELTAQVYIELGVRLLSSTRQIGREPYPLTEIPVKLRLAEVIAQHDIVVNQKSNHERQVETTTLFNAMLKQYGYNETTEKLYNWLYLVAMRSYAPYQTFTDPRSAGLVCFPPVTNRMVLGGGNDEIYPHSNAGVRNANNYVIEALHGADLLTIDSRQLTSAGACLYNAAAFLMKRGVRTFYAWNAKAKRWMLLENHPEYVSFYRARHGGGAL